ncbi:zinc finger protein 782-like isoform X2 [Ostrinia furnacalis]|uniref:zinc finger protein 782-like isoform X1 n=1 Tax=Ostrinia furnacalis TaxID=93504 RepID=UPI00103BD585|nr:zinc finger protein 782-like isoform X1 [Ostrinia furnacalis]XP_028176734.1 zinc finger protein 782-like isoform X2 [Ostrinia furnacalis]
MLAVLLLNRMSMKRRTARKQRLAKPAKVDVVVPEVFVCRTCLSPDNLESIFVNKDSEKKRSHNLKLVTGLEIKMNDGLSQKICSKCIESMNTALQFRRTSRKAEKSLLNSVTGKKSKKKYKLRKKVVKTKLKEAKQEKLDSDLDVGNDFQNDDYGMGGDDSFQDYNYQNNEYHDDDDNFVPVKEEVTETKADTKPEKKKRPAIPNAPSYKCGTCNKEFRMKATYQSHMRFHTNYCVCEACGKRCRNNNQLQEHKRARHGLGRIHKCAYCEYSAATKEALTIHERRHTGERPYVCDHCGATFHRRSNLVQHIAIHLPEKNFQCSMCDKREKSKKLLQVHQYKVHRQKPYKYVCPVCRDVFSRPGNVRQHLTRSHGVLRIDQGKIERLEVQSSVLPEIINHKLDYVTT